MRVALESDRRPPMPSFCCRCGACGETVDIGKDDNIRCRSRRQLCVQECAAAAGRSMELFSCSLRLTACGACRQKLRAPYSVQNSAEKSSSVRGTMTFPCSRLCTRRLITACRTSESVFHTRGSARMGGYMRRRGVQLLVNYFCVVLISVISGYVCCASWRCDSLQHGPAFRAIAVLP